MLQAIMDAKYHYLKHCLQINEKMTVNTALINPKELSPD